LNQASLEPTPSKLIGTVRAPGLLPLMYGVDHKIKVKPANVLKFLCSLAVNIIKKQPFSENYSF
jgi:hypothetical protein